MSEVSESFLRGSPIAVGVVDDVFSLVQLALDDRYLVCSSGDSSTGRGTSKEIVIIFVCSGAINSGGDMVKVL